MRFKNVKEIMDIIYYAIFQYDDDGICISFPDIPPCLTCAQDENEGIEMAMEALELYLHGMKLEELPIAIFKSNNNKRNNKPAKPKSQTPMWDHQKYKQ